MKNQLVEVRGGIRVIRTHEEPDGFQVGSQACDGMNWSVWWMTPIKVPPST